MENRYNFETFLSDPDILEAIKVFHAVHDAVGAKRHREPIPIQYIETTLANNQLTKENAWFGPAYAGILLAKYATHPTDITRAVSLLRKVSHTTTPFCVILADHIEQEGGLKISTGVKVFGSVGPYEGWGKSGFHKAYKMGTVENVIQFALANPPAQNVTPTIMDIGTGNGVLFAAVVGRLVEALGLPAVRIILNDQSPAMLASAETYCREQIRVPLDIVTSLCRIEQMTIAERTRLTTHPIWFALAAASMHHMPKELKTKTIRNLKEVTPHVLITEFEANNDLPETDSPELIYSILGFYGYLFRDVLDSPATAEEKSATIKQFLLTEAIIMLRSRQKEGSADELGRVDFHTTPAEWLDAAKQAGLKKHSFQPLIHVPNGRLAMYFQHFSF